MVPDSISFNATEQDRAEPELFPRARYSAIEEGDGMHIAANSSPGIVLSFEPGKTLHIRGARKHAQGAIFIDGALAAPPFSDNSRRLYNLDHHTSCHRPATRSSCEQALIAILQGIRLDEGNWTLLINDLDADSVLAAWALINHAELLKRDRALAASLAPLFLLEGIVDSIGKDLGMLAVPINEERERLHGILSAIQDSAKRAQAKPSSLALVELFSRIDELLLPEKDREALSDFRETARIKLKGGEFALFCESGLGIIEAETLVRERLNNRVGILLLSPKVGTWTIKLLDPYLGHDLKPLYKKLNKLDPLFNSGSSQENAWGGSGNIGGSPRATGTGLSREAILECLRSVYGQRRSLAEILFSSRNRK